MSEPRVVIVAHDGDYAADMVVRHLRRTTFLRLDPGKPRYSDHLQSHVSADGFDWQIGRHEITPATSVLWRKPTRPVDRPFDIEDARWAADETTQALTGTLRGAGVTRWMNDPTALTYARPKLLQLGFARSVGMVVPDTLTTTDPVAAKAFIEQGPTVVKPMTLSFSEFSPVWEITPDVPLDGIEGVPHTFQRKVDKTHDLRITVVGEEVFACRVESGELDWRTVLPTCRYTAVSVSDDLAAQLRWYLDLVGLSSGVFDMAVDADGLPWFLECNPGGEWGFQEDLSGAPISQAIAGWLLRQEGPP